MPEYLPTISRELKHSSRCFPAFSKCFIPIPIPPLGAVPPNVTLIDWMGHLSVHKPTTLNLLCHFVPLLQYFHIIWKNEGKPLHSAADIIPQVTGRIRNSLKKSGIALSSYSFQKRKPRLWEKLMTSENNVLEEQVYLHLIPLPRCLQAACKTPNILQFSTRNLPHFWDLFITQPPLRDQKHKPGTSCQL